MNPPSAFAQQSPLKAIDRCNAIQPT
jgi:hypothetical protein